MCRASISARKARRHSATTSRCQADCTKATRCGFANRLCSGAGSESAVGEGSFAWEESLHRQVLAASENEPWRKTRRHKFVSAGAELCPSATPAASRAAPEINIPHDGTIGLHDKAPSRDSGEKINDLGPE